MGNVREEGVEFPIEVAKSQEGLYGFDVGQWGPFSDSFEFDRVHLYSSFSHYHAKVFHFFS